MNYLVTGGAGFIGSALVLRLVHDGHTVRVMDDQSRGKAGRLDSVRNAIEFVQGDIRSTTDVDAAVRGVDSVIHLAFVNGTEYFYSHPDLVLEVGTKGILNVLDACLAHGVGELVVASSSEVYQSPSTIPTDETVAISIPDPLNPRYSYAGGKIISELLALNYSKHFERVVVFRPHNVYGPDMGGEHVIPQLVLRAVRAIQSEDRPIKFEIQGDGTETRAFVHIDDFTQGLVTLLKKGQTRNIYHVGSMEEIRIGGLVSMIFEILESECELVVGPLMPGSTRRRCPDIGKLRQLGFEPKTSLKEGLPQVVRWYQIHEEMYP